MKRTGNWICGIWSMSHTLQHHREQKREATDSSIHTWISKKGMENSLFEADWSRAAVENDEGWVAVYEGKGGYMSRVSRGDGSDCVADERNDLQEGFFFNRQGTFFCSQGIEAGEVWVETQSTFKGGKGLMFES